MKQFFLSAACIFCFSFFGKSQLTKPLADTIKVIFENNKLKMMEYVSTPGKDVCGKGQHTHVPHLSILLTDAKVTVTKPDGQSQIFDVAAGTAFWSETETHIAINSGNKTVRAYIVELK